MHLLYARFYHKLMRDLGLLNSDEPFSRLLTQGMVLKDGAKMSKSKGNTVDPKELINKYGADTVRLFIIFAAPPEQSLEWSDSGVEGSHRFLKRLWTFAHSYSWLREKNNATFAWETLSDEQRNARRQIHEIVQQVRHDIDKQQFNTVVSGAMKLLNLLQSLNNTAVNEQRVIQEGFDILLRLLAPIAPHITQILWQDFGFSGLIINAKFPKPASDALVMDQITMVVQVNGKLRAQITVASDADQESIKASALGDSTVQRYLENQTIKKVIVVPNKLVNIVI